jgi:hypothetical protein
MALGVTPQMERNGYKKMHSSLKAFSRAGGLLGMTSEELKNMPKEVMICCAPNEIAMVWNKLPEHLKTDIDILRYQYCTEHHNRKKLGDNEIDGPAPRRIFCCYCKINDVNIKAENCLKTSAGEKQGMLSNLLKCCKQQ